ncbi:Stk1 family PASTA domain-containing Ser/Thr kinase [Pseudoflavonifractor sp. BIOML-A6]|nr:MULTISPECIES: Stk1 family PASTA domain-containing Ser/Thr kinase [unclassified Pseudoflavonifractor]MTR06407.1 Stk1 family PASTA domain-containing Ser/Thr kinase [Pseudoflavonifractor sp. BIOML-A15]MTR72368.1 Stk1 family PASTA domain-containing Ser/Thr kinase [Pseudoflavonifractor sp. BIOML-A18]MTS64254.1 Stk1 family PASTA domain-containing Ser/Thr kinase [Pseudoflavonifractor sp. BIOML-A5]MTS70770.1 Stk1 family PASTA domain-containing Ser/Thr kinase [Pseudoflavonifractor sp. BIOML-A8]MTS89
MDQYIGKLLDNRYEILERVGAGGMAVVYKARCHRLNRLVAIKILKSDLAQDAEFRRRFHDESQAVAMLSHPNIVAVYDVSRSDELEYIVMELIDGITLKQYMQKKGEALNWREALHFITQIMKALGHAHSRGIIHRDIKPHNIMVLRDGSVKVADFGIARLTSAAQNTLTQEALGSVHYISPEQARGSHIDARSDIYSAGVVLYEMITGRLPYEGDSPISVAIQHINSIPLSPREINPEIPEALESITMKAMAANMDQRYANADAMLADLEEFRKNPNINFDYTDADLLTGGDEPTQVMETSGSLNLRGAVAAAAAGANAGSGHGPAAPSAPPSKRRREREELDDEDEDDYEERPRRRRSGGKGSPLPAVLAVGAILIFLAAIGYFLWGILSNIVVPEDVLYATPKLVGRIYDDVKNDAVLLNGFTVEVERTVDSENVREGEIISQNPDAGEEVKSGNMNISVVVSGGTSRFVMDDYTNQRASQIEALLRDKGFEVTIETEHSDVAKGYIIRQDPAKDTRLNEGDVVTLVVSEGAEVKTVTMITVVGQPLERAKSMIEELGLIVGASPEVYDDLQPVGYVVNQSVDAGSEVAEKSIVNLQISKGPDPGVTPSPGPDESTPPASEEPTPPPSESPSQPPESPPAVDLVTKQISIELPVDQDVVDVVVTVGGQTQFEEKSLDTTLRRIRPVLKGSGAGVEVCIYFDGVLAETRYEDFVK